MKDKSQFIGIILIACALFLMFTVPDQQRSPGNMQTIAADKTSPGEQISNSILPNEQLSPEIAEKEQTFFIENDVIKVTLSNISGAIKSVALKKYQATQGKDDVVVFNDGNNLNALAISFGKWDTNKFYGDGVYSLISHEKGNIKLKKSFDGGYDIVREYSVCANDSKEADGYIIKSKIYVENTSSNPVQIDDMNIFIGAMPTTESDVRGDYLNFGVFDGKKDRFTSLEDFKERNGFLGFGKREAKSYFSGYGKYEWGSIKNQFFTAVFTPSTLSDGYVACPMQLKNTVTGKIEDCVSASMIFHVGELGPGSKFELSSDFYVGPKNFSRLSAMGKEQGRIMQFGFFGAISELLLRMMVWIHGVIPNWGLAIIVLTTLVKLLLWPLTNAQVKSSKKMASIQEPLKAIRERYKNNPQKLQSETLKLFRENNVNPAAGCLPILIQIPIFFGLYYMLRTTSDLRFAHFLWIKDLSMPDSIAHIKSFPINILPIFMGITMFLQMHMTPMPTADNSQRIIFKLMPVIFLFGCYNLPSGLILYWTVQNLLTIIQQYAVSRKQGAQLIAVSAKNTKKDFREGNSKKRSSAQHLLKKN